MMPVLAPLLNKVTNTFEDMDARYGVERSKWVIDREYDEHGVPSAVLKFMHEEKTPSGSRALKPILDPETGKPLKYSVDQIFTLITGDSSQEDED